MKEPTLKIFQVWAKGLEGTKEEPKDVHLAHVEAEDFAGACAKLASTDENFAKSFDGAALTYCGCKLFQK